MAPDRIECLHCGQCCKTGEDDHDCPFLMRDDSGFTICSIYPVRLGVEIAPGYHCGLRKDTVYDFEGCPYNTDKEVKSQ